MSWTKTLLHGVAAYLADGDVGLWHPDGSPYQAGSTGIVVGKMPQAPDRIVALRDYPVSAHPGLSNVVTGLNVRCRGGTNPDDATDLDDAVWQLLHGARDLNLGGVLVAQVLHQAGSEMPTDANDRYVRTSNYYLDADRPNDWRPE